MSVEAAVQASTGLQVLVVDDDPYARARLVGLLESDPRVGVVHAAPGATAAMRILGEQPLDAVFCDVRLRELDGVALARLVARFAASPQVVFVAADAGHALQAFEVAAVDYLLKPVRPARLQETVRRLLDHDGGRGPDDETIAVELAGVTSFIHRSHVRYAEADGDYVRLHTAQGSHLVRTTLAELEHRWSDAGFLRLHRHTLVSLAHVEQVRAGNGHCEVVLGDVRLPVSRRHAGELRARTHWLRRGDSRRTSG